MQLAVSDPIQAQMNPINFFFPFFLNHLLHIAGAPRLPSFFIPIYSSHHSSNALYKASSLLIRKAFRASLVLTILLQISKQLKLHKFRSCSNSNSQSGIGENRMHCSRQLCLDWENGIILQVLPCARRKHYLGLTIDCLIAALNRIIWNDSYLKPNCKVNSEQSNK